MSNVVDARSHLYLKEIREHGDCIKACKAAGIAFEELESLCRADIKFDRSIVECHLEYLEDTLNAQAVDMVEDQMSRARKIALAGLATRHSDG